MSEGPQLSATERQAIDTHAQRLTAYMKLQSLVETWRAELELQDKANRVVARVLGALLAATALVVAGYLVYLSYGLLFGPPASVIAVARMLSWYAAVVTLSFSAFCFGMFYATWTAPRRIYVAAVAAMPIAGVLFVVGLLVAPFIAWLLAS